MNSLMSKKWWYFGLSFLIIIPGIISLILYGLNFGIDFIGGTNLQYKFDKAIDENKLKSDLKNQGVDIISVTREPQNTYLIKARLIDQNKIVSLKDSFAQDFGPITVVQVESIGPVIGSETTKNAALALVLASLMIVLYLAFSFRKVPKPASAWRFGIAAVVALLHDVLVVVGVFSLLGHFWGVEVDILFITALLTVIGFSVHDTIVVFDRIRENLPKHLSKNFSQVADISIIQTLARSLSTSLTVVFVLLAILLFGGEAIRWFTVALLIGIISGTYSSIFNATALLALWEEKLGH